MDLSRREFLKASGSAAVASALTVPGLDPWPIDPLDRRRRAGEINETTTICPYCAVGCGMIVQTDKRTGTILNTEGDPDHPINEGALCAKGAAAYQLAVNPDRITRVLYRAPFSGQWEVKTWDWALDRIAANVKHSRDASFVDRNAKGQAVHRTEGIAHIGSAALDNEECWLVQGMMRALGLVYIEHQARV
jgi:formate dehydrogenase major subunit